LYLLQRRLASIVETLAKLNVPEVASGTNTPRIVYPTHVLEKIREWIDERIIVLYTGSPALLGQENSPCFFNFGYRT
jgi:hypothetical protein